jgi:hypothetical protein
MREAARQTGKRIARKTFDKRGNHTEVHLCEVDLAVILVVAFELGAQWNEDHFTTHGKIAGGG